MSRKALQRRQVAIQGKTGQPKSTWQDMNETQKKRGWVGGGVFKNPSHAQVEKDTETIHEPQTSTIFNAMT